MGEPPPHPGGTCPRSSARLRPRTNGCFGGRPTAPGPRSSRLFSPQRTRTTTSAGRSRWIQPSAGPTSTPRVPAKGDTGRGEPPDHALGRSRGGLNTKVHLASDSNARPLAIALTAGQAGDAPAFTTVMAAIRVPRTDGGRPRTRPGAVLADRAYSSRAIRAHLRGRHIRSVIPQSADQVRHRQRRGPQGGRPPAFDAESYKERNTVERCIGRIKQWRGLAMRTDKLASPARRHSTSPRSSSGPGGNRRQ